MNKQIVITSIFYPTKAIEAYSELEDFNLVVVGDRKTPSDWKFKHVDYLSVADQVSMEYQLSKVLPYDHYSRKMLGYLHAIKNGADVIIDADDDNIPKTDWGFPDFEGNFDYVQDNNGFINIYELFTKQKIWPRGLPLNKINKKLDIGKDLIYRTCRVGVWQGLADDDPDVDAVYRLTSDQECYFNQRNPVVLGKGTICPFNTQNTLIRKELFPLLYLPTSVTFRFTDILRGLVAQPIMWLFDFSLGFLNSTVIQIRNPHDYMKDFISEIPVYLHSGKIIDKVGGVLRSSESIESNLFNAYSSLLPEEIIRHDEMKSLESWLKDLQSLL